MNWKIERNCQFSEQILFESVSPQTTPNEFQPSVWVSCEAALFNFVMHRGVFLIHLMNINLILFNCVSINLNILMNTYPHS